MNQYWSLSDVETTIPWIVYSPYREYTVYNYTADIASYIEFPSRTAFDFPVLRFASVCPALNFYVNLVIIIVIVIIRIKAKACTSRGLLAKLY